MSHLLVDLELAALFDQAWNELAGVPHVERLPEVMAIVRRSITGQRETIEQKRRDARRVRQGSELTADHKLDEATRLRPIIRRLACALDVDYETIIADDRRKPIAHKRHMIIWALHDMGATTSVAAYAVGGRHHTSALNSIAWVRGQLIGDPELAAYLRAVAAGDELAARRWRAA